MVFDICRDGTTRNQEGKCLTKEEWSDYCSNQICVHPEHYQGNDKVLGLCICQTEELDNICNAQCRRRQKHTLQIVCGEEAPQLHATDPSGDKVLFTAQELSGALTIDHPMDKVLCNSQQNSHHSVYVVKSTVQGFLGVYSPNLKLIKTVFAGRDNSSLSNHSGEERIFKSFEISGILNPTTCINVNDILIFIASKHNYPVYDVNNLYNTNPGFDWGKFRTLAEEIQLSSRLSFSLMYQFQEPGVYVMKLSSNHYKMMYIRVMLVGGQCYEDGPFFPTAPRHIIRNGIARMPPLLLKPDWSAIVGIVTGLLLILITCILLLVWFQELGLAQKTGGCPQFRKLQLKFNFNTYSSKGSTVTTLKKLHPRMRIIGHIDKKWDEADKKRCHKFLADDEFWDYEQQVDMECFNTQIFFDILLKQSLLVTAKLGLLKEEVKIFYEKLVYEVSALKEIFVKRLSLTDQPKGYTNSILESYATKKQEAELEIEKRKRLAAEYEDVLNKGLHVLQQDMMFQEEHCVVFNCALRESFRFLEMLKDKYGSEGSKQSTNNYQKLLSQFEELCNRMYSTVMKESHRLKAWGVLGEGTGANLLNKDRTRLLSKGDLIALDGSMRECDVICVNPTHGLLTPTPHSVMLLASHYLMPVPGDYFVHSESGKVLPIAGNVGYDPASSELIHTVDSAFGEIRKTGVPIIPYVPYPLCRSTGLPVNCKLPSIHHQGQCEVMVDPVSGLEVPVLGVTIHPQTRQKLALGGTYLHPLTNILSPIDIGGPMMDAKKEKIVPILGIGLDNSTGDVIPLGGLVAPSGSIYVLGDVFSEPLSGKNARIQGIYLHEDKLVPYAGGYQALLESNMLIAQINVINALKGHKYFISEDLPMMKEDFDYAHEMLHEAVENMKKSISIREQHMIYRMFKVINQQKMAVDIKCNGGHLGMINYPKTELWIPAVLGMEVPDPGPSELMVPIIGVEHDFNKGHLIPLAGTMEDADGKGLIPIKVGARTINPITGNSGSVVGAQTNPLTGIVMPIVQSLGVPKERDYYLLEILEKELNSRGTFWHNQKKREKELLKDLDLLTLHLLDVAREGKTPKIRHKDKILTLEETCQSLEESSLCEAQRRTTRNLNSLSLKFFELPFIVDGTDVKELLRFSLVVRKALEKLAQWVEKIEQEAEKLQKQLMEWQKTRDHHAEEIVKAKQRTVMLHLVEEFEDHIMKRLTGVDSAYCRLEYVRERSNLQGLHVTSFLLGTTPHFMNSQATYWNINDKEVKGQMLMLMLKHLIKIIEEKKNPTLSSEAQAPVSGYSSRSTLKASAANSDNFPVALTKDTSKHTTHMPLFINAGIRSRNQRHVFRLIFEKQASELVHLEQQLVTEEINRIWDFYESYKVDAKGHFKENLPRLVHCNQDKHKPDVIQHSPVKRLESSQDLEHEWMRLLEELADVHRNAHHALHQKHQEEVKSVELNPDTAIPENHLGTLQVIKDALVQLAMDMQKAYEHPCYDCTREVHDMSSVEAKVFTEEKDSQRGLLRTIAAKFVRQELLTQIHMYRILDTYNKHQVHNGIGEVQKMMYNLHFKSCSGKAAAEEAASQMEEQQIEKVMVFLRKSHKEEEKEQDKKATMREMQSQLKEEHYVLTESLLQVKDKLLFQEMASSEFRNKIEHIVCCVLSQRHLRQTVMLLQETFKTQKQDKEKLSGELRSDEDTTGHLQEDILNLVSNNAEVILLLMELHHAIKRIQLRECQLEEIASSFKEYCSNKVNVLACVEEAHYLGSELHTFRVQKLKKLKNELEHLSEESRAKEKCKTQPPESEDECCREEKEMLKVYHETQAKLEQAHRTQISEERLKLQDQLERGELNGWIKQKLIKEHDETVAFLERTLQRDLEKLKIKLKDELKKKGQNEQIHPNINASSGRISPQNTDQNIVTLLAENVRIFYQAEQIAAARITLLGPPLFSSILPDGDSAKSLESSPVLTLLKEVDTQLRACALDAGIFQGNNELDKDKGNAFRDIFDLPLTCKGNLTPVHPEELSAREFVIYQYGIFILHILKTAINSPEVTLHVASKLPENSHKGNAFSSSFFYQSSGNNLFVSREYLQSVGSFILLLVHCVSHIASEDLNDDLNPFFLRIFYQAVKVCFSDGFFTRFQMSTIPQNNGSGLKIHNVLLKGEPFSEKSADLLSKLFSLKLKPSTGKPSSSEPLKDSKEMLSQHNIETLLRSKQAARKREFFSHNFQEPQINCWQTL
ncbi:uncharacterized protein LOC142497073 isoform X2 [Ascaphus truei]|uniref:uncharacterized protein LOC142497073 isoform X2 n=1 Tax=Ascaphus truei TaxID=8439 RepID=UPI003F595069